MLNLLSPQNANRLLGLFQAAGYSEENIRKCLGATELPSRQLRNQPRLLDKTRGGSSLEILLRWFWLGLPQATEQIAGATPQELLKLLLESGLLTRRGDQLVPGAMLLPIRNFLVAADHPQAIDRGEAEMVLWPNPTSAFLTRFAVRRHSSATLDLGTGSGILSLEAAAFSDRVVATDLNRRAVLFTAFNARLNNIETIEALEGSGFEPVAGRKFDLILSNPPFFITPKSEYMFCDNSMELDQLCRQFVQQGPEYLNEGGYMQMLCEWAQVGNQPWEDRIAEWLEGNGCDGWVMKGATQEPAEYAQHRIRETNQDSGRDQELFDGYMAYYRDRKVEAIHDGLIVLRRRSGPNWIRIEEVPKRPAGDLGEMVLAKFAAQDLLQSSEADEKLLAIRPQLSPYARLEQIRTPVGDHWQTESLTLRLTEGFPFHLTVQPLVADFLATCDGTRDAESAIQEFAVTAKAPLDIVRRECVAMLRKLIERGLIFAATESLTSDLNRP